jgi:hypothetical protein
MGAGAVFALIPALPVPAARGASGGARLVLDDEAPTAPAGPWSFDGEPGASVVARCGRDSEAMLACAHASPPR